MEITATAVAEGGIAIDDTDFGGYITWTCRMRRYHCLPTYVKMI